MIPSKENDVMRTLVRAAGALTCAAMLALLAAAPLTAQGVTTAAVRGRVVDETGTAVVGALIQLLNTSTGQRFESRSRAEGLYYLENVAVGGPYVIEARAIGYQPARRSGITLTLGQALDLELHLARAAVELEAIAVTAEEADQEFNPVRNGTQTIVNDTVIARLPTLDRDFADFVRLTPQVAVRDGDDGGITVVGQNNRFNTIQVDGSTVNDRFGLGRTGQAGGQAGGRAVGLEAVKEYQVLLAPYDVRQGNFTGALINAVTKNGTNTLHGSAFYYFRNADLAGDPLGLTGFKQHQFGASLGGPIVRDRLHFFANAEFRRREAPATGPYLGQPASVGTPFAAQADVDGMNAALQSYGLPTGSGGLVANDNPLNNLLARLDYQLGSRSRLVFRYTYNTASDNVFSRLTSGTFDLSTIGYTVNSKTHNPTLQFFTNFASGASNEVRFSLNRLRDRRPGAVAAPLVIVQNFNAADGSGTYQMQSGTERFSQGNELDQDIWELTDNFTFPVGDHRVTIGTRNELYKVRNFFAQGSFGVWTFDDLADFQNGVVEQYEIAGHLATRSACSNDGISCTSKFNSAILGLYAQDQWQIERNFSITYGLRMDVPVFFTDVAFDQRVLDDFGPQDVPSGQIMWAPRLGFNWDVGGNGVTQVRGGAGMFAGTPAYVWWANTYANNGTGLGRITCTGAAVPAFNTDVADPTLECADGSALGATTLGEVDLIAAGTQFPQVLRANLAVDRRLPGGFIGTFEALYTKGINDYYVVNRNLRDDLATVDPRTGRVMYGTIDNAGRGVPRYVDLALYGPSFNGGVYEIRNTSNNYSWALTGQLQKRFSGSWWATVGYTRSHAVDAASFTSSRATSNWRFGRTLSGSQLDDGAKRSSFDRPQRLVVAATYTAPWRRFPTDISLSYIGQSGQPYTLLATGSSGRGDLNADGQNGNDPIYIPLDATNAAEMTFANTITSGGDTILAADQATAFNQYIADEPCLNKQRGSVMARNSCRSPWQSFLNLTIRQTLPRFGGHAVTLEFGVFNLLNLLNEDWGLVKSIDGGVFSTPNFLNVPSASGGVPRFQFDPTRVTERFRPVTQTGNSYQMQVALRYAF
jgi:hypothetical protein